MTKVILHQIARLARAFKRTKRVLTNCVFDTSTYQIVMTTLINFYIQIKILKYFNWILVLIQQVKTILNQHNLCRYFEIHLCIHTHMNRPYYGNLYSMCTRESPSHTHLHLIKDFN